MKTNLTILLLLLFTANCFAQNEIADIIDKSKNFKKITQQVESYFQNKYPGKTFNDLSTGVYRDGKFVKYMRWKSYWEDHLNPDGTLGNIAHSLDLLRSLNKNAGENPYDTVSWTNISHENYITGQISLGRTTCMAFHPTNPDIFYVGAAIGGIWKTVDGGNNYEAIGDQLPYLAISSIIVDKIDPSILYIAVSDHVWYGPSSIGVYKSIDGGQNWNATSLNLNIADNIRIYWMSSDPNQSNKIYAATADGLYETLDGFETSTKINSINCSEIHFKPNDSNTIYLGSRDGEFYRSTDGGANFNLIDDFGDSYVRIAVSPLNDQLVYVTHSDELYKSQDSGSSFPLSNSLPESNMVISFSPNNTNEILTGNFEIYKSVNQGSSFNVITNWLGNNGLPLIHVDQRNIFTNPLINDLVYFCNDGGIYTYNVNTFEFTDLSNGLKITQYYDIATAQSDPSVVSGGSQDNGSIYRNSSGVWDDLAPTGDGMNTEIDPNDHNIIYWEYQNGGMRRNISGSNTNISPPGQGGNGAWETPYRLDPNNSNRIICAYDVVYESLDQGSNWAAISTPLSGGENLNHVAISKSNGNRIYAVKGSTLYVKDIATNTWNSKSTPTISVSDIEVDPLDMNTIYITNSGYADGSKVFKSTDAGDNWINISGSLPNVPVGAIELYEDVDQAMFVGTDQGVFYRDYQTNDWLIFGNLPNTRVEDIEIQYMEQLLRVGTHGRGMFEANINIKECTVNDPDTDNDGICDLYDLCPFLDDNLIGMPCDDEDPLTSGESYSENCQCENGASNINYCSANGSAGTGSDWIKRISFNEINHVSGQTFYSDFRNINTTLYKDSSYTIEMELNHAFPPDSAHVWIDYNRNGIFENTEEIVMSSFNSNHISEANLTLANLNEFGATTMRVRNIYAFPSNGDPCNNYFGEVEDYTIYLVDSCPTSKYITNKTYCEMDPIIEISQDSIISENTAIHDGSNIKFESGECIQLLNGFEAKEGSLFEILIGGCMN